MSRLKYSALAAAAMCLPLAACGTVASTGSASNASSAPAASASGATAASGAYVNVVKLTGIAWFDRMETGIKKFASDTGKDATQTGPSSDAPEQQVSIIQSLIAQKPAVLGVVPSDPNAVDAVVKQAKSAGIVVVTHEAPKLTSQDVDIEPFDNISYGESIMKDLGACMKGQGQGQYVQFVGKLTAETHMAWSKGAYDLQLKNFPDMKRISDPVESNDNADQAYAKAKQLLQANPKLVGFEGASSQDVPGIARAIKELGLESQTCVFGTGVPSETKDYLASGAIDAIYLWDPALAGEAMMHAGMLISSGKAIATGTDLGVDGYNSVKQSSANPKTFLGDAQLKITKDTVSQYNF